MYQLYLDAEAKILKGQTVSFQGRSVSYANLKEIQDGRRYWQKRANAAASPAAPGCTIGGSRFKVARFNH